jgi:hypothetical protein
MSSTTSRMALYKPAAGETVNVVTDLDNNWDSIDLNMNFRSCTSSTRPSVKWDGMTIHETDTRKSYVWNATPAVSGWYQIYTAETGISNLNLSGASTGTQVFTGNTTGDSNSRFSVRADGRLEWGSGSGATDSFLRRTASNTLTTDGAFTIGGTAQASGNLNVGGAPGVGGGSGVLGVANATSAPTAAASSGFVLYGENGRPKIQSDVSGSEYLGGAYGLSPSSPVTVVSTSTETTLGSVTLPANDAVVGSVYKLTAWGEIRSSSTPTIQWRFYLGANQLAASGAISCVGTVSGRSWRAEGMVVCLSAGNPGSWFGNLTLVESISGSQFVGNTWVDGGATVANATTSSNTLSLTADWSTASSSNSLTARGFVVTRVA